ncbi:MAG: phosphopeptide-binding protein [Bacteroidota bacterium]
MQKYFIILLIACQFPLWAQEIKNDYLTLLPVAQEKNDAPTLQLTSPTAGLSLNKGERTFQFKVQNYELKIKTPDADLKLCANSKDGQHIHFIWNNQPYTALYDTFIKKNVTDDNNVLLAFLSRSYHLSLKNKSAYVIKAFSSSTSKNTFDVKAPHMFYSRPKGDYIGPKNIQKILLDFYLVNCTLSANGYKVRATIDGLEFMLTTWQAYTIEGLKEGKHEIKLELLNKKNELVKSPYNPVIRSFVTAKEEPLAPK